ncbi:MAG TPA: TonB C-terminal domain-containing protein [Sulfuricurvum sp.]|nr:TonB C-terminal domain-containing protein [Sulfuricurvum sp.]
MTQSEYVSVSIMEPNAETQKNSEPQPSEESAPVQEEERIAEPEPIPEISDLFSQVKAEKSTKKPKEDTKRTDELNALEKELRERKESPRFSDKVSKVELVKPSVKMIPQGGSSGPLVNEYHGKIQALVYTYFRPPSGTAGEAARIRMKISAEGKLISYKVMSYSGNGSFNGEVDWLKDRLTSIRFPEHPDGKDAVLECILTAKE